MIKMYSDNDFTKSVNKSLLQLKCEGCGKIFYKTKKYIKLASNKNRNEAARFCSSECYEKQVPNNLQRMKCGWCGKDIIKKGSDVKKSKSGNCFCSISCCVKFNNHNNPTGTTVSNLEKFIRAKLLNDFPNLLMLFNSKSEIGFELDIFAPSVKIAFELNGIHHYKPIHGDDKLKRIRELDELRREACLSKGIDLVIIDTSCQNEFDEESSHEFYSIINNKLHEAVKNGGGGGDSNPSCRTLLLMILHA